MRSTGRTIATFLLLLTATLLVAQNAPPPKYRVLEESKPDPAALINAAADQGYRLLFAYPFPIMRLDATPPDTYRYLPAPESGGGQTSLLNALNQQGALGYRWLDGTPFLEKAPHPRNYEYRTLEGFTMNARESFGESLLLMGFRQVNGIQASAIFVREIGNNRPTTSLKPVRVADAVRKDNVAKKVSELAAQGYRYQSLQASRKSGRGSAVRMEACDSPCGGPFEYRSFDVKNAEQLEHDLNELAHDGFRVVADSLGSTPLLAERPANRAQGFVYRIVEASDSSTTERLLNEGDRDGFIPIGFATHIGWKVHPFVVLEKTTASVTP